jgi:hypothetical protein
MHDMIHKELKGMKNSKQKQACPNSLMKIHSEG